MFLEFGNHTPDYRRHNPNDDNLRILNLQI